MAVLCGRMVAASNSNRVVSCRRISTPSRTGFITMPNFELSASSFDRFRPDEQPTSSAVVAHALTMVWMAFTAYLSNRWRGVETDYRESANPECKKRRHPQGRLKEVAAVETRSAGSTYNAALAVVFFPEVLIKQAFDMNPRDQTAPD